MNEFHISAAQKQLSLRLTCYDGDNEYSNPNEIPSPMNRLVVIGDGMKIEQVMRNLLSNAIKFSPTERSIHVDASWMIDEESVLETITENYTTKHRGRRLASIQQTKKNKRKDDTSQSIVITKTKEEVTVASKGHIKLTIRDEGAGLTTTQISQIFEENAQFNANELQGGQGCGLGLYIAEGIVDHHNGHIKVSSDGLGEGSTFTITLPLYEVLSAGNQSYNTTQFDSTTRTTLISPGDASLSVDEDQGLVYPTGTNPHAPLFDTPIDEEHGMVTASVDPATASPRPVSPNTETTKDENRQLKILIVDDSITNRKLLARVLKNHGHDCDLAENGLEAVQIMSEKK
jgi:CheY-like chemotaxis protein